MAERDSEESEPSGGISGLVAAATEMAPLAGAIGVVVYVLGGAVLFARLALADLPEETVIGYLPRDFLMTIGVTEVLVPGLLAAGAHAAWRVFGPADERRFTGRDAVRSAAIWTAGVVAVLFAIAHVNARDGDDHTHVDEPAFWIVGITACLVAVCGAEFIRWRLQSRPLNLKLGPPWMTQSLVYALAAMVVATVIATTVPLPHARVCLGDGRGEPGKSGTFIGESDDRIFLGEDIPRRPRITLFAADDVEQLFIGHDAKTASCE